ncbi:MAG: ribosome maturation factor RimP [Clostridiales bacterium]|nr:ribosome maturation factor RimP [Clostridiales bacterium]
MKKVTELTAELALPLVEQAGCTLWDVEYVREAGTWYLRVFIDCPEGVSINQCEAVSRPLSDLLDETDPIEGSYVLEVGSAGADRALKKPTHFAQCMGQKVDVKLYRPRDGKKEFQGTLTGYEDGTVTITDPAGEALSFGKKETALVRLHIEF